MQIHPILIVFIIIALLTGTFIHLFIIFIIILWHELGHFLMAKYFNWQVDSVVLWVFGGVMKTDEHGTTHLYEDILVTIAGPIQHLFIFLLLIGLQTFEFVSPALIQTIHFYNFVILLFNLLPIYPLDGGKLLFYLLSLYLPFRKAHYFIIIFSMISVITFIVIQLVFYPFTLSVILIMLFLLFENVIEWRNRLFVFRRFLLKRLALDQENKQKEMITVHMNDYVLPILSQFKRERVYTLHVQTANNSKKLRERECLQAFFGSKKFIRTFSDFI